MMTQDKPVIHTIYNKESVSSLNEFVNVCL